MRGRGNSGIKKKRLLYSNIIQACEVRKDASGFFKEKVVFFGCRWVGEKEGERKMGRLGDR